MRLIKWNHEPMINNLIGNLFDNDFGRLMPGSNYCGLPSANVIENEDAFVLELAAPGMKKDDFKIDLENSQLTISHEQKEEHEETEKNFTRREFHFGSFSRSFVLPKTVDTEKISAEYKNGILYLNLPKKEEEKARLKREIKIS
jgi:HSP20 family protein